MGRITSKGKKPKINPDVIDQKKCPDKPSFSFEFLTTNKKYNFEKLDKRNGLEWRSTLLSRIIELTQNSWQHWQGLGKEQELETIPFQQIHFNPNNYSISEDEKVIVFRFNSQKGRILGIKDSYCSVYYVIGMDTDYSAYNHG